MRDIKVKRGWAYFLLGLALSFYTGLSLRINYSAEEVSKQVRFHLHGRLKNVDFQFEKVQIKLSNGWMPTFRFAFEGISVTALKKCKYPYEIKVRSLELPVSFFPLLKKDLKFSGATIGTLHILPYHAEQCEEQDTALPLAESTQDKTDYVDQKLDSAWTKAKPAVEAFQAYAKERVKKEIENLGRWIGGLAIEEVLIETPAGLHSRVKNLEIDFIGGLSKGTADWQLAPRILQDQPLKNIAFSFELDEKHLLLDFQGLYKEGRIYFRSDLNLSDLSSEANLKLKNIPVDSLSKLLVRKEDLLQDTNFNWSWLNCDVTHRKAEFSGLFDDPIKVSDCVISGREIDIKIPDQELAFQLASTGLKLNIVKLPIRNTMLLLNQKLPIGVFKDTGILSGKMDVLSREKVEFEGQVQGLEFFFTNKGKRAKQVVHSLDIFLNKENKRFSGKISNLNLDRGAFEGLVTFNLSQNLDEGVFQFAVDKLDMHATIDSVIMDGEIEGLALYGKGIFLDGNLEAIEGEFGAVKLKAETWMADNLKSKVQYMKNQPMDFSISLDGLAFTKNSSFYNLFSGIRNLKNLQEVPLKNLSGNITLNDDGGEWKRISFSILDQMTMAASDGRWLKEGEIKGDVYLDFPTKKMMLWEVSGLLKEPYLTPSLKLMEELKKSIPEVGESNVSTPVDRLTAYKSNWDAIESLFLKTQK